MSVSSCSNLVHHAELIPPERMLASECPSLSGKVLCAFLKTMDRIEWNFLKDEDNALKLSNCELDSENSLFKRAFYYITFSGYFGGCAGFVAKAALATSNPISSVIGVVAGVGVSYLLGKGGAMEGKRACADVSIQRKCRLMEKQSSIEKRENSLRASWFFSHDEELNQLNSAKKHFLPEYRVI